MKPKAWIAAFFLASQALAAPSARSLRDGVSAEWVKAAEAKAGPAAAKILAEARAMTLEKGEILPGACWDYVNTAWKRAGYPSKKRATVFKGKKTGPYAKAEAIQPGDWLYFINHSYNNIEHSAMFVGWQDQAGFQGIMLSYAGEKRAEPARYMVYNLKSVYQIIRARD